MSLFLSKKAKNGHFLAVFCHFLQKKFKNCNFLLKNGQKWSFFALFLSFLQKNTKNSLKSPKNRHFWPFFSLFEKKVSKSAIFGHFLEKFYCSTCSIFLWKKRKGDPLQNPKKGQKSSRLYSAKIEIYKNMNLDLIFIVKNWIFWLFLTKFYHFLLKNLINFIKNSMKNSISLQKQIKIHKIYKFLIFELNL